MTAVSLCRRSSSSAKSNARCFRSLASSRWNYSFKYGTSPAWKRHTIPTMRRVNYGKASRPSDMTSYHRNDKMFTSFVRSQVYPPGRKRMKHFKRRHTANETGIIATNARQTHVLFAHVANLDWHLWKSMISLQLGILLSISTPISSFLISAGLASCSHNTSVHAQFLNTSCYNTLK